MVYQIIISILLGFVSSVFLGFILIPLLRKLKAKQSINYYLRDKHHSKEGTPTMGGLIFVLPTLFMTLVLIITGKLQISYTLLIVLFTFCGYMLIGFVDDYLIARKHNNKGLSRKQKLAFQLIIALIFFYLFMKGNNEPVLWIHSINFRVNIGFFYGLFILFVLLASSNAVNLTDGLDGLAAGLCVMAFSAFGIISFATGWLDGYKDIAVVAFLITGCLLGFLLFNFYPAKVFMGDTGSLALGATLGAYAIMTRHEVLLIIIGLIFVLETLSCIIQIIYFKLTRKRLFPMTPIHHTFEKLGMKEKNIVYLFWFVGLICSLISLMYGVIL